jgi:hypothetical protein
VRSDKKTVQAEALGLWAPNSQKKERKKKKSSYFGQEILLSTFEPAFVAPKKVIKEAKS